MHKVFALLLAVCIGLSLDTASAQKPKTEDTRVNLTRVLIDKARQVGKNDALGKPQDGYEAVKDMVWQQPKPAESEAAHRANLDRLNWIVDFAQGCAELERNPSMAGKEIKFDIVMGSKEKDTEGIVIVTFLYPDGVVPPGVQLKGFEWRLTWKNVSDDPQKERWQLERVTRRTISFIPGHAPGIGIFQVE